MIITLYRSTRFNYEWAYLHDSPPSDTDMVKVSEPIDVQFVMLADKEIVGAQLQSIADAREEVVEKFSKALAELDNRKATLLAITQEII